MSQDVYNKPIFAVEDFEAAMAGIMSNHLKALGIRDAEVWAGLPDVVELPGFSLYCSLKELKLFREDKTLVWSKALGRRDEFRTLAKVVAKLVAGKTAKVACQDCGRAQIQRGAGSLVMANTPDRKTLMQIVRAAKKHGLKLEVDSEGPVNFTVLDYGYGGSVVIELENGKRYYDIRI